jgi:NhaP-type Na+/H+ or K+/H+ antiporter
LGIIVSVAFEFVEGRDTMKDSIMMWDKIDPHLILYVFLPALLFGEAMNLNPHHFRNALNSALLIAFPGAVFSAFAIGTFAHYILPYSWPWSLSMILGAILCTTDAVGKST